MSLEKAEELMRENGESESCYFVKAVDYDLGNKGKAFIARRSKCLALGSPTVVVEDKKGMRFLPGSKASKIVEDAYAKGLLHDGLYC